MAKYRKKKGKEFEAMNGAFVFVLFGLMLLGILKIQYHVLYWKEMGIFIILLPELCKTIKKIRAQVKILNCSMLDIHHMTGENFEVYLMHQFRRMGYRVTHTGQSGDFGADLILNKYGRKTIVQAKRYSGTVGIKAVQEVISAREYYHAKNAIVVTNSYFTKSAKELARKCKVKLWDRDIIKEKFKISDK